MLRQNLFDPLAMTASGFGDPSNDRSLNHPWGHTKRNGQFVPWDPAPEYFSEVPFGSAYGSILHSSAVDLAKYGIFHLRGDLGLDTSLSTPTFRRLHHATLTSIQPLPERFSAGFFNEGEQRSDGRWVNVQHWGYYARGRTLFWFSPQANVGAVILTNGTDEDPVQGMRPISEAVIVCKTRGKSILVSGPSRCASRPSTWDCRAFRRPRASGFTKRQSAPWVLSPASSPLGSRIHLRLIRGSRTPACGSSHRIIRRIPTA